MKQAAHKLSIFGGTPVFAAALHVGQPVVHGHDQLLMDINDVFRSGVYTNNGPRLREFELTVARLTGASHCVAVCNATIAIQIAARAMNLTGEVIVPAFTFIATAHALQWIGLTPVFADVDPHTHTLCPDSAAACLGPKTSAILPVHLWGHIAHTERFRQLTEQNGLRLIYDASHAFGCQYRRVAAGNFGHAEVFSFHATKFVHAFEGGAIVTNDGDLANRCRSLRAFGISGLAEITDIGTNGKMHELSACAGLRSIESMPERMLANAANRHAYARCLRSVPGLSLLSVPDENFSNSQYVVLRVDEERFGLTRDQLVRILRAEGVFARSYFNPGCHRAEPYRSADPGVHVRVPLPVTEMLSATLLQLPTGLAVSADDAQQVGKLLRLIHQRSAEIRRLWTLHEQRLLFHPADPSRPDGADTCELIGHKSILREAG